MGITKITDYGYYAGENASKQEHDDTPFWIAKLRLEAERDSNYINVKFFFSNKGINFNTINLGKMKEDDFSIFISHDSSKNDIFYIKKENVRNYIEENNIDEIKDVNPGTMFNKNNERYVTKIGKTGKGAKIKLYKLLENYIKDPIKAKGLISEILKNI